MASKDANRHDPAQLALDFSSALDDRRRQLKAALVRLEWPRLLEWSLCLWVLHVETEQAGLVRSYRELAENLWCDPKTIQRSVGRLMTAELLLVVQTFDSAGDARQNEYRLAWPTIRRLVGLAAGDLGFRQIVPTFRQNAPTFRQNAQSLKEQHSSDLSSGLTERVKGEIPELKAAALRTVVPLPANSLVYDPLAPVTIDHLGNVASLVEWHQRQLSLAAPLCGDTEADLLLVLAAATHALELPSSEIKKSRAKVFAWQVRTGKYTLALRYVPQARISLDRLAAARGAYWLAVPIPATEGSR